MMIIIAMALAAQDMPYPQDRIDQEIEQRAIQEAQAPPMPILSAPPVQTGEPMQDAAKQQVRNLERRLERVGDVYEVMGRCAGSMSPAEVESTLRNAQGQRAAPYLLGRYEKGFRKPKDDKWCYGEMQKIDVGKLLQ